MIIQLETAVGAAMKNFDRAIGMCVVCASQLGRLLPKAAFVHTMHIHKQVDG